MKLSPMKAFSMLPKSVNSSTEADVEAELPRESGVERVSCMVGKEGGKRSDGGVGQVDPLAGEKIRCVSHTVNAKPVFSSAPADEDGGEHYCTCS